MFLLLFFPFENPLEIKEYFYRHHKQNKVKQTNFRSIFDKFGSFCQCTKIHNSIISKYSYVSVNFSTVNDIEFHLISMKTYNQNPSMI